MPYNPCKTCNGSGVTGHGALDIAFCRACGGSGRGEMVDATDLKSVDSGHAGSSPAARTKGIDPVVVSNICSKCGEEIKGGENSASVLPTPYSSFHEHYHLDCYRPASPSLPSVDQLWDALREVACVTEPPTDAAAIVGLRRRHVKLALELMAARAGKA